LFIQALGLGQYPPKRSL